MEAMPKYGQLCQHPKPIKQQHGLTSATNNMAENFRMNTVELLNQVSFDSAISVTSSLRSFYWLMTVLKGSSSVL